VAIAGDRSWRVWLRGLACRTSARRRARQLTAALCCRLVGWVGVGPYWSAMDLDEYQRGALRTAAPRDKRNELLHLVLGLVGESGEIAEKFKKWVRDLDSEESRLDRADIAKELGDVLWYLAVLADYLDLSLEDIATANLAKLASRQGRGVLAGSGDNR
jgi:NTP pyrophosphatase (non-canonical NTP hydrolase)